MTTTYFAEIDPSGVVLRVVVASPEEIAGTPGTWVQTWPDGGARKNYAAPGYTFDAQIGAFIAPKPSSDYDFDAATATWKPSAAEQSRIDDMIANGGAVI